MTANLAKHGDPVVPDQSGRLMPADPMPCEMVFAASVGAVASWWSGYTQFVKQAL